MQSPRNLSDDSDSEGDEAGESRRLIKTGPPAAQSAPSRAGDGASDTPSMTQSFNGRIGGLRRGGSSSAALVSSAAVQSPVPVALKGVAQNESSSENGHHRRVTQIADA